MFSAINVLSHALLGRRIPGNFTLPPACDEIEDGPNKGKCYSGTVSNDSFLCPELEGSLLLGMSTHFLGTREACRNETGPCQMEGPNGYGDDIDYFLQVVSFEGIYNTNIINIMSKFNLYLFFSILQSRRNCCSFSMCTG